MTSPCEFEICDGSGSYETYVPDMGDVWVFCICDEGEALAQERKP
jgi:hypothetical protein